MNRLACLGIASFLLVPASGAHAQDKKGLLFQSEYFPLAVGNRWVYRAGKQEVVVEVERQETIRRKIKANDEFRLEPIEAFRLKIAAGEKTLYEQVLVAEDGIYRFSAAGKEIQPPLRILKTPVANDAWIVDSVSENVLLRGRFVSQGAKIAVPAYPEGVAAVRSFCDDFQNGTQRMASSYWFVPRVGIVRQDARFGTNQVSMELIRFEPAK